MKITECTDLKPLKMPWKYCIGMGRAYELLRQDVMEHLTWLQKNIGFETCRFHALFHDDMDVMRLGEDGKPYYQWHHIDKVYDAMLEIGLRPFIELNPMPSCIASGDQTIFFYNMNVTPPSDFELWQDLIYQFTKHITERYGAEEVSGWYFEVWNEPNLRGFWSGTKEEYFELYKHAALAVKRVNPAYKVGGPASSKSYWLTDLINYCSENNVPIDFTSTHLYGQDEYVEYPNREGSPFEIGAFFTDTVKAARKEVDESCMPELELHYTEWNTQMATPERGVTWGENPDVDTHYAAAHIVKHCMELDGTLDSFSYWVATDIFEEGGIPDSPFSRTYGLLTIHGIPRASAHAFLLLNKLKGRQLLIENIDLPKHVGVAATTEGDKIHFLAWYFNPHEIPTAELGLVATEIDLSSMLGDGDYRAIRIAIEPGSGSANEAWEALGAPRNITKQEEEFLRASAIPDYKLARVRESKLALNLKPGDVVYFEIAPYTEVSTLGRDGDFATWDIMMGEKSL